jgi:hypothetical protein
MVLHEFQNCQTQFVSGAEYGPIKWSWPNRVPSRFWPGGTEKMHEKPQPEQPVTQPRLDPSTSRICLQLYVYASLFGEFDKECTKCYDLYRTARNAASYSGNPELYFRHEGRLSWVFLLCSSVNHAYWDSILTH